MGFLYSSIILLILIIIISIWSFFGDHEDSIQIILNIFFIILLAIIAIGCISIYTEKPTAIDVYQGKTTLEITYKDDFPIDSVVVWKGGEK